MSSRSEADLYKALSDRIENMRESVHAIKNASSHDVDRHLKRLTTELRAIACDFGNNKALLLRLIEESGAPVEVVLGGPPLKNSDGKKPPYRMSYRKYIEETSACHLKGKEISNYQFIRLFADSLGAHEDTKLPKDLVEAFRGAEIAKAVVGMDPNTTTLVNIATVSISCAEQLFNFRTR